MFGGLLAKLCLTLCEPMDCNLSCSSIHGILHGKNSGVGCHFLLQRIFLSQGSNPGLLHCRQVLCQLSYQGCKYNDPLNVEDRGKIGVRDLKMLCCWHCRWRKDHKPVCEDVPWKLEQKEFILTWNILTDPNAPDVLI